MKKSLPSPASCVGTFPYGRWRTGWLHCLATYKKTSYFYYILSFSTLCKVCFIYIEEDKKKKHLIIKNNHVDEWIQFFCRGGNLWVKRRPPVILGIPGPVASQWQQWPAIWRWVSFYLWASFLRQWALTRRLFPLLSNCITPNQSDLGLVTAEEEGGPSRKMRWRSGWHQ